MNFSLLATTTLFRGMNTDEIQSMLKCLSAETRSYSKGSIVYHAGNTISSMGLVLSGSVSIENDDVWGNKSILDKIGPGQVFGETYACVPGEPLMVSVVADEPTTEILFLDAKRVLTVCSSACTFHSKMIQNLLAISSQKNLNLSRRIFHTSSKSIRGRLLSYLSFQCTKNCSRDFDIPFSRQQLADYLSVDRSAMSNELSKMQRDGLISVERNHFRILEMDTDII